MRYDQLAACVGLYQYAERQDHRTLIEATEDGWWYRAGLPQGQRVAMFFSDTDQASFRRVRESFSAELEKTRFISKQVPQNIPHSAPRILVEPAYSAHADQVAGPGWLALGDAAMRFDPLSSQGLWTAFQGAEKAALAIQSGSDRELRSYAGWCSQTFKTYLADRQKYYDMEQRWRGREFWQRRSGAVFAASALVESKGV